MQISKITKCSLVNIPHHKQQSNCIPRQQQQKKQTNRISKGLFTTIWSFYEC